MNRDIFTTLQAWQQSPRRKPLILEGARQVGKTYALKHFGLQAYRYCAYFNFEQDERLAGYFKNNLTPKKLINMLSLHSGKAIEPHKSLIIFDEIQECPQALNSLKYFYEQANEYHLAAAGSLLGVKTANHKGFPVGKVNFLRLYPLTFAEFLTAISQESLAGYLNEYSSDEPLPIPLHEKLVGLLKEYLYVGGMPEAVKTYRDSEDYNAVREVHLEILAAYERDFAKHAPNEQIMKINTVWQQVPQQLAKENKKFIFSAIKKSARGREYEQALAWLVDAGLLLKSLRLKTSKLPMKAYADASSFKLFLFDVGLLGAQTKLNAKTLIEDDALFTEFKGAFTENYVAQALVATLSSDLYYWVSAGTAEIDFILQWENHILPLEAKAGISSKKKSLLSYINKCQPAISLRSTLMNLKRDKNIYNCPLYMIGELSRLLENQLSHV